MQIVIDTLKSSELGLSLEDTLLLYCLYHNALTVENIKHILEKNNICILLGTRYPIEINNLKLTLAGKEKIETLLKNTTPIVPSLNSFEILADKLREIFPKGNMPNTKYAWRGSTTLIAMRLRSFTQKFGKFSDEEIIAATKRYVNDYQAQNYKYMQLLKYFIWKNDDKNGIDSQLLNYINNPEVGLEDNIFGNLELR